jgi:hypothetical protein
VTRYTCIALLAALAVGCAADSAISTPPVVPSAVPQRPVSSVATLDGSTPSPRAIASALPKDTASPAATVLSEPTPGPPDRPPSPVGYDPNATLPPAVDSTTTPNPNLSDRERIDRYWSDVDDVGCVGMVAPESLFELEVQADLIVLGRPLGGQSWDNGPYLPAGALVTVEVTDVLKRLPNFPPPPTVIQLNLDSIPPGTVADIEHLLFLRVGTLDNRVYYLSDGYMSIFANVDGQAVIPEYEQTRQTYHNLLFTTHLDGLSFDALVRHVRNGPHIADGPALVAAQGGYFAC